MSCVRLRKIRKRETTRNSGANVSHMSAFPSPTSCQNRQVSQLYSIRSLTLGSAAVALALEISKCYNRILFLAGNKVKKSDRKKNRRESDESGGDDSSNSGESNSSEGSSSESSEDEDDEPVYQLRQRRAAVNNYRFNDYDQLIDSAIQVSLNLLSLLATHKTELTSESAKNNIPNRCSRMKWGPKHKSQSPYNRWRMGKCLRL